MSEIFENYIELKFAHNGRTPDAGRLRRAKRNKLFDPAWTVKFKTVDEDHTKPEAIMELRCGKMRVKFFRYSANNITQLLQKAETVAEIYGRKHLDAEPIENTRAELQRAQMALAKLTS